MSHFVALSAFVALAGKVAAQGGVVGTTLAGISSPSATFPPTPLFSERFPYPSGLPYQADPNYLIRGAQTGYNVCNSTTEGPSSLCQTSFINSVDDFCLWSAPVPDRTIGESEADEVAWCTKPGRGTRLIPAGALTGVQFMETTEYIQVVGFIDQTQVNLTPDDYGGELDPHGADLRGNPLGGLVYSNYWSGSNDTYEQVPSWNLFIGSGTFCFKACNPHSTSPNNYCENRYDEVGCTFNMPNNAQNGTFETCEGDVQGVVGTYTSGGQTLTWTQPYSGEWTIPYATSPPASSSCTTYQSANIYSALGTVSATASGASATATGSGSHASSSGARSGTASAAGASQTASGAMSTAAFSGVSVVAALVSAFFLL